MIPLSDKAVKTLQLSIKDKKGKEMKDESLSRIAKERKQRENALEQLNALNASKEILVQDDVLIVSICHTLAAPLRKQEKERTEADNQIIETILHLLSNLSYICRVGNSVTTAELIKYQEVHYKLIQRFEVSNHVQFFTAICNYIIVLRALFSILL